MRSLLRSVATGTHNNPKDAEILIFFNENTLRNIYSSLNLQRPDDLGSRSAKDSAVAIYGLGAVEDRVQEVHELKELHGGENAVHLDASTSYAQCDSC